MCENGIPERNTCYESWIKKADKYLKHQTETRAEQRQERKLQDQERRIKQWNSIHGEDLQAFERHHTEPPLLKLQIEAQEQQQLLQADKSNKPPKSILRKGKTVRFSETIREYQEGPLPGTFDSEKVEMKKHDGKRQQLYARNRSTVWDDEEWE